MLTFLEREQAGLKERWPRVVMLLTCLAMVLVVSQQGGTITAQSNLIRLLWDDSKQLNRIRVQELMKQRMPLTDPQVAPDHRAPKAQKPPAAKAPAPPSAITPMPFNVRTARILWRT